MITIRLNYYDYAYNVNEILEQIACEFGVVKLELVLLNEVEQFSAWQLASGIDLSQTRLTINGESIWGGDEIMEGVIDEIFKKIKELDYVNFGNEIEIIYAKSICFKILALIEELQFDNQRGKQIRK